MSIHADRGAAGVSVLDDHARGRREASHRFPGRIAVGDVVVGEFLTLELAVTGQKPRSNEIFAVKRRHLMRIFAVAHILHLHPLTREDVRELLRLFALFIEACEVVGDCGIVPGGMGKDFLRKRQTHVGVDLTLRFNGV